MNLALILTAVFLAVIGQLLLKQGTIHNGLTDLSQLNIWNLLRLIFEPFVLAGLAVYGIGAILWIIALTQVELSYAYPMISLSYVLVFLFSWLLFGENIPPIRVVGIVIIVIGVFLISRS